MGKVWGTVLGILSATLAATLFSLPVLTATFGRISLLSPLANLLILPVLPFLFALGLLMPLATGWFLTGLLSVPLRFLSLYILGAASALSDLPFASLPTAGAVWAVFISYLLLGGCLCFVLWRTKGKKSGAPPSRRLCPCASDLRSLARRGSFGPVIWRSLSSTWAGECAVVRTGIGFIWTAAAATYRTDAGEIAADIWNKAPGVDYMIYEPLYDDMPTGWKAYAGDSGADRILPTMAGAMRAGGYPFPGEKLGQGCGADRDLEIEDGPGPSSSYARISMRGGPVR
jgi:hypothetical protein